LLEEIKNHLIGLSKYYSKENSIYDQKCLCESDIHPIIMLLILFASVTPKIYVV
jgi:hypothetical protein